MDITEQLTAIREHRSETAVTAIVARYSRLVFSVAARRLGTAALADECTQEVFVRFVQVAPRLRDEAELVGWLHATAHRVAIDSWRKESRRRERELKAAAMPEIPALPDPHWRDVAPLLDEALQHLPAPDRQAVLLRYCQCESLQAVGAALGLSEDAAKMRLRRALEKLRVLLVRRGVTCTAVGLALLLEKHAAEAAVPDWAAAGTVGRILARAGSTGVAPVALETGILLVKTKLLLVLLVLTLGFWYWHSSRTPSTFILPTDGPGASPRPALTKEELIAKFRRSRPGAKAETDVVRTATRLQQLREILAHSRRVRTYPPASLAEALWSCSDIAAEAAGLLAETLASTDYETRHWAAEGLVFLLQDPGLAAGHDAARRALARLAAAPAEADELRTHALTALLAPWSRGIDGEPPRSEPLTPELLGIFTSSFAAPGIDAVSHNMLLADLLQPALAASGLDAAPYRNELLRWLNSADPDRQLGAAYALSGLPGEKPPAVRAALVRALEEDSSRSPTTMAARALGRLGVDAADSATVLQQFLERHADSAVTRTTVQQALIALRPDWAERHPEAVAAANQVAHETAAVAAVPSLRSQLLASLLENARNPALQAEMLDRYWMQLPARYVEPLREAVRQEAAKETDPATAQVLAAVADRIAPQFPVEIEEPLAERLPDPVELLARALTIAGYPGTTVTAETQASLKALGAKFGGGGPQATTRRPDALRQIAIELHQADPALYREALRSFLDAHPDLDRVFRESPGAGQLPGG